MVAASGATIEDTRQQQAKDIFDYEKMVADQQTVIDQGLGEITLAGVEGAQNAAAASEQMAAAAFSGAAQTAAGTAQSIYEQSDLYKTSAADRLAKEALNSGLIKQNQAGAYGTWATRHGGFTEEYFNSLTLQQKAEFFIQDNPGGSTTPAVETNK